MGVKIGMESAANFSLTNDKTKKKDDVQSNCLC